MIGALAPTDTTFARLLVPVDFCAGSRRALAAALVLQRGLGSEIHLFNLTDYAGNDEFLAGIGGGTMSPRELVDDAKGRLHRFVENVFPGRSADVHLHARMGVDVVHGIERMAREIRATLVLLAGRRKDSLFRTDLEKIVRELDGAVMLLWIPQEIEPS